MFSMGLYLLPEGVHASFDQELSRFFLQARNGRQKYHMVKWADICTPKDLGGLGILASRHMNVALMLKWVWRILTDDGGLWLQLIQAKCLRGRPLLACDRREGSQFWRSLQDIKHRIRLGMTCSVGHGAGTLFWLDTWVNRSPLRSQFPELFAIYGIPMALVADAVQDGAWTLPFRRSFGPAKVTAWQHLRVCLPAYLSADPYWVSW